MRDLVNAPPKAGLNNLAVTHKTNIADAFGKEFADVREGEALVYKTSAFGPGRPGRTRAGRRMDRTGRELAGDDFPSHRHSRSRGTDRCLCSMLSVSES